MEDCSVRACRLESVADQCSQRRHSPLQPAIERTHAFLYLSCCPDVALNFPEYPALPCQSHVSTCSMGIPDTSALLCSASQEKSRCRSVFIVHGLSRAAP